MTLEQLAENPRYEDLIQDAAVREDDSTEFDRYRRFFTESLAWLNDEQTLRLLNPTNRKAGKKAKAEAVQRLRGIVRTLTEDGDVLEFDENMPPHLLREMLDQELELRLVGLIGSFATLRRAFKHKYIGKARESDLRLFLDDKEGIADRKVLFISTIACVAPHSPHSPSRSHPRSPLLSPSLTS